MNEPNHPEQDNVEPKLVVDDDWKEQVAKEKGAKEQSLKGDDFVAKPQEFEADEIPPPPPTFEILISMMFTQAMSMLGQIPDPSGERMPVNKPYAKHTIDTLEMLGEKTKGNLTDDESGMLAEALHALRMAYVNTKA